MRGWFRWLKDKAKRLRGTSTDDAPPEEVLVTYLAEQISVPGKAKSVFDAVNQFERSTPPERQNQLSALYLLIEQYLTEIDPVPRFTRDELRQQISKKFPTLQEHEHFYLIFEPPARQKVLLCRAFLMAILRQAHAILGAAGDNLLLSLREWVARVPDDAARPVPLDLAEALPDSEEDWTVLLMQLAQKLYLRLEAQLGEAAERLYENSYHRLAQHYLQLETFPVVIRMLPEKLLDESKIRLLSHSRQLQARDRKLEETQGALVAARTAALESAAQLQAVLNTVGEGIITIDAQGTIVLVNQEAGSIWGYTSEELIGRSLMRLIPSSDWPDEPEGAVDVKLRIDRILGQRVELKGRKKNGSSFPLEIRIQETRIGRRLLFTAAVRDITERKHFEAALIAAKEQAEELARLKSAFLTNMSHEIRTPITAIMGYAQVLSEEVGEKHQEFVDYINENGKRLLNTLNAILDLSKLQSDAMELHVEPVDLAEAARSAVNLFAPMAAKKDIALRSELSADAAEALLDRAAVDRILSNLVGNAIKFTEEGEVVVQVGVERGGVRLTVRDTGIGISEDFIPHLFDDFKQESTGLARSHEGSGLGLAITRQLVEAMGGMITVESQQGEGSAFTVAFPSTASVEGGTSGGRADGVQS